MTTPTLHLTHTGPFAGTPFCGCDKAARAEAGDTFGHVPYSRLAEFFALPQLCPACKAVWDAAGAPGDDVAPELDVCSCGAALRTGVDGTPECPVCWRGPEDGFPPPAPFDYTVTGHGSIALVQPNTHNAETHLRAHVGPEAQWFGGALAVEPRYLADLVEALYADGFNVEGRQGDAQ